MIKKYIYTFQNTLGNKLVFKYTKKKKNGVGHCVLMNGPCITIGLWWVTPGKNKIS